MKVIWAGMMNPTRGSSLMQRSGKQFGGVLENASQAVRRDRVSISGTYRDQAKQNGGAAAGNYLKSLIERKDFLHESRQSLMTRNVSGDLDRQLIKGQIKELDGQIEDVNQQIAEYMLQKQREALGIDEEGKKGNNSREPLSADEVHSKQMEAVAQAQNKLSSMAELRTTRASIERSLAYEKGSDLPSAQLTARRMEMGIRRLEESEKTLLQETADISDRINELAVAPTPTEESETKTAEEESEEESTFSSMLPQEEEKTEEDTALAKQAKTI